MERVGIYNRCSTEEESQRNALAAQAAESREIAEKMGWIIIEQYIESETGTVAYKRREYQRLLADMEREKFDIVMIKSIDRLMRSARDWYFFLSRLTENKLKLYIYIEGKFYTPEDNLISGIKAILAEDFSRELSKKIKNAHRRRQEKKSGLNITCEMFGWNKIKKDLYEINQEEAAYYRTAFRLAKEGKGFYTISNVLYELGARTRSGQKISQVQWRKMLYTPRAHGTMLLNTRSYNFDTRKYEKVPEENWIYMENALPPIVSKKYQEEVLRLLGERTAGRAAEKDTERGGEKIVERAAEKQQDNRKKLCYTGKYQLSRKLICAGCGNYYYRVAGKGAKKDSIFWKCSTFLKNGRTGGGANLKGCDNPNLKEEEILRRLAAESEKEERLEKEDQTKKEEVLEKEEVLKKEDEAEQEEELLSELMELIEKALKSRDGEKELRKLVREQERLSARKDILMEKLLSGVVCDQEFKSCHEKLNEKLEALNAQISIINQRDPKYNNYECRLEEIKEAILNGNLIKKAKARQLLEDTDHILVNRDGSLIPRFKGRMPPVS